MSSTSATTDPTSARPSREAAAETVRANLYHLLSRAFSSPLDMDEDLPAKLRSVIPDLRPALKDEALHLAEAWEHALEDRQALSLAYARLFLGPFEILAPPYASFYLEADHRLMGEVSRSVARAYAEAGLAPGHGPREAPDHVALEWEFMHFLTHRHVVTGEERWLEQRSTFRASHLDLWMPLLAEAITRADEHPFYGTAAVLLSAVVKEPESR